MRNPKAWKKGKRLAIPTDGTMKARQGIAGADRVIPQNIASFQGLHVWVSQVDSHIEADGLDRVRLWLEVQKRLARAGVPVPQQFDWLQTPKFPCLGVLVHADQAQVYPPFYIFSVEVFFVQRVTVAGVPAAYAMRMTWCREAIGDIRLHAQGYDWSNLYSTVGSLVDNFIQESLGLLTEEVPAGLLTKSKPPAAVPIR